MQILNWKISWVKNKFSKASNFNTKTPKPHVIIYLAQELTIFPYFNYFYPGSLQVGPLPPLAGPLHPCCRHLILHSTIHYSTLQELPVVFLIQYFTFLLLFLAHVFPLPTYRSFKFLLALKSFTVSTALAFSFLTQTLNLTHLRFCFWLLIQRSLYALRLPLDFSWALQAVP